MSEEKDQPEDEAEEKKEGAEGAEGAEGGEDAEGEGDAQADKKKKIMIIAGAAVVLLIAIGAGLYFTGMLGGKKEECVETTDDHGNVVPCPEEEHGKKEEAHGGGGGGGHGEAGGGSVFLQIPPMIVNLNSEDGTPRYLRLSVQLEMFNPADGPAVEAVMPRVVDQFQTYLRELRVRDLRGSSGIYRLQTELLWRVNQAAAPVKIKDVLFQEILIQ